MADTHADPFLELVAGPGSWPRCAGRHWWIHTFTLVKGDWYKWHLHGWNDHAEEARDMGRRPLGPEYVWSVPRLVNAGNRYVFRLKPVA
jgi:hypothetical protein